MLRIETIGTETEKGTNYESLVQLEGSIMEICQSVETTIEAIIKAAEKNDRMLKFAVMGAITKVMQKSTKEVTNDDVMDMLKEMLGIKEGAKC